MVQRRYRMCEPVSLLHGLSPLPTPCIPAAFPIPHPPDYLPAHPFSGPVLKVEVAQRTILGPLLSRLIQLFNIIYLLAPNLRLQSVPLPTLQTHTFACLLGSPLRGLMGLLSHFNPFLNDFFLLSNHTLCLIVQVKIPLGSSFSQQSSLPLLLKYKKILSFFHLH